MRVKQTDRQINRFNYKYETRYTSILIPFSACIMHFRIFTSHKYFQLTDLFFHWHVTSKFEFSHYITLHYIVCRIYTTRSNKQNDGSYCLPIYEISTHTTFNTFYQFANVIFLLRRFSLYSKKT